MQRCGHRAGGAPGGYPRTQGEKVRSSGSSVFQEIDNVFKMLMELITGPYPILKMNNRRGCVAHHVNYESILLMMMPITFSCRWKCYNTTQKSKLGLVRVFMLKERRRDWVGLCVLQEIDKALGTVNGLIIESYLTVSQRINYFLSWPICASREVWIHYFVDGVTDFFLVEGHLIIQF